MVGQLPRRRPPRQFTALEGAVRGLGKTTPGRDYETFRAWLYALDVFIPLDAFGQEKNMGRLHIARLVGRAGSSAALTGANVRLGDYRHRRGRGHWVDRPTGLTFRALRVMGGVC